MTKKSKLMAFTAITISACFIASAVIISHIPNVKVFSVNPQTVESTVVCTGKMEYSDNKSVNATELAQIDKVFVSEGDTIKKGDKLYSAVVNSVGASGVSSKTKLDMSDEEIIQSVLNGDISSLDDYDKDGIAVSTKDVSNAQPEIVYSEYDGVVGEVSVNSGQLVSPGDELIKIAESDSMQARLAVSENKIGDIKVGQRAIISCNALKNNNMSGTVSKIGSTAKQTTTTTGKETTVDVIVKIDKGLSKAVKPGYSVKCTITVGSKVNAVILPYEAIKYDESGDEYVLCYSSAGICEKRQIKTGEDYKNGVEVLSGIDENELIISSPEGIAEQSFAKATEEEDDD